MGRGKDEERLITEFAQKHRLRTKLDLDGTTIIEGRPGRTHLYQHSDDELGLMFITAADDPRPRLWTSILNKAIGVGMIQHQGGAAEGSLLFDPRDHIQAKVAMRLARARPKKVLSENHIRALREGLSRSKALRDVPEVPVESQGDQTVCRRG